MLREKGVNINMLLTQDVVKAMAEITKGTQKEAKLHLDALKEVITTALKMVKT